MKKICRSGSLPISLEAHVIPRIFWKDAPKAALLGGSVRREAGQAVQGKLYRFSHFSK